MFFVVFNLSYNNCIIFGSLCIIIILRKALIKDIWLKDNFPIFYKAVLSISSLIITVITFYFLNLIFMNFIESFLLKLWSGLLKMESNNNNGDKYTNSDSGKIPGKKPNMEPDEPLVSVKEKREKRLEQNRIWSRNRRIRKAEEQGRKIKQNENLDHLDAEQKKERARQQSITWARENRDTKNESYRARYALNKQAEGKKYKPHKKYEQTSQPVEQASELVRKLQYKLLYTIQDEMLSIKRNSFTLLLYKDSLECNYIKYFII